MKIFALNLSCERDQALSELMRETLIKYGQPHISFIRTITTGGRELPSYGNGSGWEASMMKLSAIDQMIKEHEIKDDDFVLSVDSDVVFCTSRVFDELSLNYGILGVVHKPPYQTQYGMFGHCSGALIFIRGDIAKLMCALSDDELHRVRMEEFKKHVLTENEDVVLSYLAMKVGAKCKDLDGLGLSSGNFEEELKTGNLKSYYHLNYNPGRFLDEDCPHKWNIPQVLERKGIEL